IYEVEPVHILAFDTGILGQISNFGIDEYGIDVTYNTNNMGFKLYVLHAEVDFHYYIYFLKIMANAKKEYE
ncbi:13935_t:CDS:1, partial [Funneliformis geosporum]